MESEESGYSQEQPRKPQPKRGNGKPHPTAQKMMEKPPAKQRTLHSLIGDKKRYLVWKYEEITKENGTKKLVKVPYYTNGNPRGKTDTPEDLEQLDSYEQACKVRDRGNYDGVAIALTQGLVGIDLDHILKNGTLDKKHAGAPIAKQAKASGFYIEVSPSGEGLHILGTIEQWSKLKAVKLNEQFGIEAYANGRYFTFTENIWKGCDGANSPQDLTELYEMAEAFRDSLFEDTDAAPYSSVKEDWDTLDKGERKLRTVGLKEKARKEFALIRKALWFIPSDDFHIWTEIAFSLHHFVREYEEFYPGLADEVLQLYHKWSEEKCGDATKYDGPEIVEAKWKQTEKPNADESDNRHYPSIFHLGKRYGYEHGAATKETSSEDESESEWSPLQSLSGDGDRIPFPLEAFKTSPTLYRTFKDLAQSVQVSHELVAFTALGCLSLPLQVLYDVDTLQSGPGPVGVFLGVVQEPSSGKSTILRVFMRLFEVWMKREERRHRKAMERYNAKKTAWDIRVKLAKQKLEAAQADLDGPENNKEAVEKATDDFELVMQDAPAAPKMRVFLYDHGSVEGIAKWMAEFPYGGILNADGGTFLGSHAMKDESMMATLSMFCRIFSGEPSTKALKNELERLPAEARFTILMSVQRGVLDHFLKRSGELATASGFMARFLMIEPRQSPPRLYQGKREDTPAVRDLLDVIETYLGGVQSVFDSSGNRLITRDEKAHALLVAFHDKVELLKETRYASIREHAGRASEIANRLAAIIEATNAKWVDAFTFETEGQSADAPVISAPSMQAAIKLMEWELEENVSMMSTNSAPAEFSKARELVEWFVRRSNDPEDRWAGLESISYMDAYRGKGRALFGGQRNRDEFGAVVELLRDCGYVKSGKVGKTKYIFFNPALFNDALLK